MEDSFKTIKFPTTGLYKDKGSKFLSFAFPVKDEEEINQILEETKKKYYDARHHCYAWILGEDKDRHRENDDGEPSNTAGKPILGQILSKDISNVLIIVVRYFGGTLLGTGGLIQAYKTAAKLALDAAKIIDKYIYQIYLIHFSYEDMNIVMKVVKDLDMEQFDQIFELNCSLKIKVKRSLVEKVESSFALSHQIRIIYIGEE